MMARARLARPAPRAAPTVGTVVTPARQAEIDALDRELGTPLPGDVLDWWRVGVGFEPMMGGTCLLPPLYRPVPLRQSLASRRIWLEIEETERHRHPDRGCTPAPLWASVSAMLADVADGELAWRPAATLP